MPGQLMSEPSRNGEAADCIEAQAAEIAHWKSEITRMGDKLVESADRLLAQHAEIARLKAQAEKLDQALAEIIARWDSPKWKDVEPTADVINRARAALADYRGK